MKRNCAQFLKNDSTIPTEEHSDPTGTSARLIARRGFRESKDQKKEDWNKKFTVDSGKVSSNIRHGECGDVDLGCIPVELVAYTRVCVCACLCANTHTHARGSVSQ